LLPALIAHLTSSKSFYEHHAPARRQRTLVTDEAGRFNAPALAVGHYEIVASKNGFRVDRRTSITLVIGQREELNLKLQVGDVHQTVEVPADPGIVQITTEDISGLVGERQVKDLPVFITG